MNNNFTLRKHLAGLFFLIFGIGVTIDANAQTTTYGNEWINYSQQYYKIKVIRNGIYRLDFNYLSAAGFGNADPQKLQVFRKGKEVAIFVSGEGDGKLDNTDYLEFFGERNDGKTDRELYQNPANKIHDYYSFYTDTAAYFITVSTANGKRMAPSNLSSANLTPETWHYQTRLTLFTNTYSRGIAYADSQMPWVDKSEGFYSDFFGSTAGGGNRNNPGTFRVDSVLNVNTNGPEPTVEIAINGAYFIDHNIRIAIVSPAGTERVLGDNIRFGAWDYIKLTYKINFSEIAPSGLVTFRIKTNTIVPTGGVADFLRMAYIKIQYPRNNILSTKDLYISAADSSKTSPSYLVFEGAPANPVAYDITDVTTLKKISGNIIGSQVGFVLEGKNEKQRKFLVTSSSKFIIPLPGSKVSFKPFDPAKAGYIIISHKSLAKPSASYSNPVRAYSDYRASVTGGKHDTLVFYADQLYNQFHYGDRSAVAIRRLMKYLIATGNPQYLFLLGKGIEPDNGNGNFRRNPASYAVQDLVPTGGAPGSDIIFTADFENNSYFPKVPTGRVSATSSGDVASYLDKIKDHDALPLNAEWRKDILHLGGGTDQAQQNTFRNYLATYESIAKRPYFGAKTSTITRGGNTNPVFTINVADQVNAGLSLITFFGHSSPSTSDIDIGYVSSAVNQYNNAGKYPMILLNGCFSGNTYNPSPNRSFGEDWVLTPKKGALAFVAHSAFGYTGPLNIYSRNFYSTAFSDINFYGKSIGIINQETVKRTASSGNEQLVSTATEMVLQSDPAVVLFGAPKPDLAIKGNNISIRSFVEREAITAATDSFQIVIPVRNLGKATLDSVTISINRNGVILDSTFAPIFYQDTIFFNFNSIAGRTPGETQFEVFVDHLNKIDELDEVNNKITFNYNFPASGARAILPVEFAIVNTSQVNLVGQATDLMQKPRDFYFEIDTTQLYNSPAKKSKIINAGAVPMWKVDLLPNSSPNDSIVYYWRFRFDQVGAGQDTVWGESSFRYIPGSPNGWSQSKLPQFATAKTSNLEIDEITGKQEFNSSRKRVDIRTAGGQISTSFPPYGIFINNSIDFSSGCGLNAPNMLISIFSDVTLEPFIMPSTFNTLCATAGNSFYHFRNLTTVANQEYLRTFLEAVPDGYYVVLSSIRNVPFSTFSPGLKAAFNKIGSKLIDEIQTGYPFALVSQKGRAIGTANEVTASFDDPTAPTSQVVSLDTDLIVRGANGSITSSLIGPAQNWDKLYTTVKKNGAGNDSFKVTIRGIDLEGKRDSIHYDNITSKEFNLSQINAKRFPYLELTLNLSDAQDRTAPQLKEWLVTYGAVPEGIVRTDIKEAEDYSTFTTQAEKGKIDVMFAFQNISETDFSDSLVARVSITGNNSNDIKDIKVKPILKGELLYIPYTIATRGLSGNYKIRLTVNPILNNANLQVEQYYSNNTIELPFSVNPNVHPTLDVVFDGKHILDGDIVSPNPMISITVKDEDKYTFLKDPNNLDLFIKTPDVTDFTQVNLAGTDIKFYPADENNDFKLEYNPKNLPDGIYSLRVQAKDVSNNSAGTEPYIINFEVINESTISHFYPYPNPFSSKTRFVFTLTGSSMPQDMKIQIMTLTGKVVREIMQEELGPLKIGNNISEYAWDGTDEFGDKLANGVYLYRVIMDTGEAEFKQRNTAGDKSFKKDYGKLYILR